MFGTLFKFFTGAVVGAAVGGVIAVFAAPERGEDLQNDLRAYFDEVKESGRIAEARRRAELEARFLRAKEVRRPYPG